MSQHTELAVAVEQLKSVRILCVGDLMLDCFVYGHVDRISPEAPIPVLRIEREVSMLGGAGNVVRNVVGLGARAEFVSVVGSDPPGREVTALVGELDQVEPHLLVERQRQTTMKRRFVAGSQQLLRADLETVAPISDATVDDILSVVEAAIPDCGALVLSDYAKGVLTTRCIQAMIAAARRAGKPVIVDPKGADFTRYRGATLLTPNRREIAEATQMPVDTNASVEAAARHLIDVCEVGAVLCTRGAEGMSLIEASGAVHHLPAAAREVFDVSGAGDTVVATLASGIAAGLSWSDAAELANVAAGIVVGKVGTAVAFAADLIRALQHDGPGSSGDKIATLEQAVDAVARWRRQGLQIGFTNGCFDLLHPGHVSLMAQAKASCDRLVVGLNSDASVRRLKGPDRPVQAEAARAAVLSSLSTVDLVVVFGEDTPLELIKALRPDVLVKGADYRIDQVVGADLVHRWGGRVLLAELSPGHSTTATIRKLAR
ncbi:MAG TPA: D-glycero-beta-D-manno-heptose-7-phosphate kinase [Alphaproteobacteria bacterium]|nr:D-glycero-beta-D-manno-heptose-7-phosphate kinase [Alphaproteobacteria bacterium]